jgi:hypothetical protein
MSGGVIQLNSHLCICVDKKKERPGATKINLPMASSDEEKDASTKSRQNRNRRYFSEPARYFAFTPQTDPNPL